MNCHDTRELLSEYIDSALPARAAWEVERHLSGCSACTGELNSLRRTVGLLADAPRFETSDDFMAKLQARIALAEPNEPAHRRPALQGWGERLRERFRPAARPAWGAALGVCAVAAIVFASRPAEIQNVTATAPSSQASVERAVQTHGVALAVTDPLGDAAAASLAVSAEPEPAEPSGGASTL